MLNRKLITNLLISMTACVYMCIHACNSSLGFSTDFKIKKYENMTVYFLPTQYSINFNLLFLYPRNPRTVWSTERSNIKACFS